MRTLMPPYVPPGLVAPPLARKRSRVMRIGPVNPCDVQCEPSKTYCTRIAAPLRPHGYAVEDGASVVAKPAGTKVVTWAGSATARAATRQQGAVKCMVRNGESAAAARGADRGGGLRVEGRCRDLRRWSRSRGLPAVYCSA